MLGENSFMKLSTHLEYAPRPPTKLLEKFCSPIKDFFEKMPLQTLGGNRHSTN